MTVFDHGKSSLLAVDFLGLLDAPENCEGLRGKRRPRSCLLPRFSSTVISRWGAQLGVEVVFETAPAERARRDGRETCVKIRAWL